MEQEENKPSTALKEIMITPADVLCCLGQNVVQVVTELGWKLVFPRLSSFLELGTSGAKIKSLRQTG